MSYREYFPAEMLALQEELKNHKDIVQFCLDSHCRDTAEVLGCIASKLGILLDGVYDPVDLCDMLVKQLKQRNALVVVADPRMIPVQVKESKDEITIERMHSPLKLN